jgi:hypothetical protein
VPRKTRRRARLPLDEGLVFSPHKSAARLVLDDALIELAHVEETAKVLGVHPNTVMRDWNLAKI